jgi:arabinose-5-phosphate isomerase
MKSENLPFIGAEATMKEVIHTMTDGRLGLCIVNDGEGIITDGDLRRQMEENTDTFLQKTAGDIMKRQPKTIDAEARLSDAEEMMTQQKITSLLVSDHDRIVGVIQIYDLNR